jgi:hypothetical protein
MAGEVKRKPTKTDLLRSNPNVDVKQIRQVEKTLAELRSQGLSEPKSQVRSPYGQRFERGGNEDSDILA